MTLDGHVPPGHKEKELARFVWPESFDFQMEVLSGLLRQCFWRAVEASLIGGVCFQAGAGSDSVVKLDVPPQG